MKDPLCQLRGHKIRVLIARYCQFIRRRLLRRNVDIRMVQVIFPGSGRPGGKRKAVFNPVNLQMMEATFPNGPEALRSKMLESYRLVWEKELYVPVHSAVHTELSAELDEFYEQERELIAELFLELA